MSVAGASNCLECVMGSYADSNGKIKWLGLCGTRCTMAQNFNAFACLMTPTGWIVCQEQI